MRIDKLHYKVYGKFMEKSLQLASGINVVYGENESGKSTIFNSIQTLIYGFSPASREKHPYVNWQRDEIDFEAMLTFEDKAFQITRQLRSAPKMTVHTLESSQIQTGRNEALPWTREISDKLYAALFHLTPEMLLELEGASWEAIQEKLIFNYGMDYLNKTSDILKGLQQELSALWRSDRRGNPKLLQLEAELREHERDFRAAGLAYERLEMLMGRHETLSKTIQMHTQVKKKSEVQLATLRQLFPIREYHDKIILLNKQLVHEAAYREITTDDFEAYENAKIRLKEAEVTQHALEEALLEIERALTPLSEESLQIIEAEHALIETEEALRRYEANKPIAEELLGEFNQKKTRIERELALLFDAPFVEASEAVKGLNLLAIQTSMQAYLAVRQENGKVKSIPFWARAIAILMLLGLGVGAVIFLSLPPRLQGILMMCIGACLGVVVKFQNSEKTDGAVLSKAQSEVEAYFMPLKAPDFIWEDVAMRFVKQLEDVTELIYDADGVERRYQQVALKCKEAVEQMRDCVNQLGVSQERPLLPTVHTILQKRQELKATERVRLQAQGKMAVIKGQMAQNSEKMEKIRENLDSLGLKFSNLGMGNPERGLQLYRQNLEIDSRILHLREAMMDDVEKLEAYKAYPNPEHFDDAYMVTLQAEIEDAEQMRLEALEAQAEIGRECDQIRAEYDLAQIESLIFEKRETLQELTLKRDRLLIQYEILKDADDTFRRLNQPDILNRVSALMARMSKGRYQRVLISESFELQFWVDGTMMPITKAFSKGTLNQLFLAFRLAVIETLSASAGVYLPIVLDEAFVHWDRERFLETLRVLESMGTQHQIIILTCHNPKAWSGDYHLIELEAV